MNIGLNQIDMKAELRIGNYIYRNGEVATIYGIMNETDGIYVNEGICGNDNKPIPLTEKWLIDFEMTSLEFVDRYFIKDDFSIDYNRTYKHFYFNIGYDYGIVIEYIHELQNLYFALVGEELTLKK